MKAFITVADGSGAPLDLSWLELLSIIASSRGYHLDVEPWVNKVEITAVNPVTGQKKNVSGKTEQAAVEAMIRELA